MEPVWVYSQTELSRARPFSPSSTSIPSSCSSSVFSSVDSEVSSLSTAWTGTDSDCSSFSSASKSFSSFSSSSAPSSSSSSSSAPSSGSQSSDDYSSNSSCSSSSLSRFLDDNNDDDNDEEECTSHTSSSSSSSGSTFSGSGWGPPTEITFTESQTPHIVLPSPGGMFVLGLGPEECEESVGIEVEEPESLFELMSVSTPTFDDSAEVNAERTLTEKAVGSFLPTIATASSSHEESSQPMAEREPAEDEPTEDYHVSRKKAKERRISRIILCGLQKRTDQEDCLVDSRVIEKVSTEDSQSVKAAAYPDCEKRNKRKNKRNDLHLDISRQIIMKIAQQQQYHMRPDCTNFPFHQNPRRHCSQCYCYVCDIPAVECRRWKSHCRARTSGFRSKYWKKLRLNELRHRLDCASVIALDDDDDNNGGGSGGILAPFGAARRNKSRQQPRPVSNMRREQQIEKQHKTWMASSYSTDSPGRSSPTTSI